MQVKRFFHGHGTFVGTVSKYILPYFEITYTDGDSEEMTPSQVHSHRYVQAKMPDGKRARVSLVLDKNKYDTISELPMLPEESQEPPPASSPASGTTARKKNAAAGTNPPSSRKAGAVGGKQVGKLGQQRDQHGAKKAPSPATAKTKADSQSSTQKKEKQKPDRKNRNSATPQRESSAKGRAVKPQKRPASAAASEGNDDGPASRKKRRRL